MRSAANGKDMAASSNTEKSGSKCQHSVDAGPVRTRLSRKKRPDQTCYPDEEPASVSVRGNVAVDSKEPDDEGTFQYTKGRTCHPGKCVCKTCLQRPGEYEKDLLPEEKKVLKWDKMNVAKNGVYRCSGCECTECFSTRRKHQPDKTQAEILDGDPKTKHEAGGEG